MGEVLPQFQVFSSADFRLKKCVYTAYAARVLDQEEAGRVIEQIGRQVKGVDVIPFAIRLVKSFGGDEEMLGEEGVIEEEVFREDNGDFGVGELLSDLLANEGSTNMILVVTRVVKGCYPPEMLNQMKVPVIKEAASSALGALRDQIRSEVENAAREEEERRLTVQRTKDFLKSQLEKNENLIRSINVQIEEKSAQLQEIFSYLTKLEPLKLSYEQLLRDIEVKEAERNSLELAMEQAEDMDTQLESNRNKEYAADDEQVEKSADSIKERFFKSKEELGKLRVERRKLEPDYKKIFKMSKSGESTESEIKRLKEALTQSLKSREDLAVQTEQFNQQFQCV